MLRASPVPMHLQRSQSLLAPPAATAVALLTLRFGAAGFAAMRPFMRPGSFPMIVSLQLQIAGNFIGGHHANPARFADDRLASRISLQVNISPSGSRESWTIIEVNNHP